MSAYGPLNQAERRLKARDLNRKQVGMVPLQRVGVRCRKCR